MGIHIKNDGKTITVKLTNTSHTNTLGLTWDCDTQCYCVIAHKRGGKKVEHYKAGYQEAKFSMIDFEPYPPPVHDWLEFPGAFGFALSISGRQHQFMVPDTCEHGYDPASCPVSSGCEHAAHKPTPVPTPMTGFTAEQIAADPILKFFEYDHLPMRLQESSKPFRDVAYHLIMIAPRNAERSVALRKLLEAKDAAVRARIS